MTGPAHYEEAENLLKDAEVWGEQADQVNSTYARTVEQTLIARAQVHATLALVAANTVPSLGTEWSVVVS